jgi:hypothetical protein
MSATARAISSAEIVALAYAPVEWKKYLKCFILSVWPFWAEISQLAEFFAKRFAHVLRTYISTKFWRVFIIFFNTLRIAIPYVKIFMIYSPHFISLRTKIGGFFLCESRRHSDKKVVWIGRTYLNQSNEGLAFWMLSVSQCLHALNESWVKRHDPIDESALFAFRHLLIKFWNFFSSRPKKFSSGAVRARPCDYVIQRGQKMQCQKVLVKKKSWLKSGDLEDLKTSWKRDFSE